MTKKLKNESQNRPKVRPAGDFGSARRNVRWCRGGTKGGVHRTRHGFGQEFGRRFGKDIWGRNYKELEFLVRHAVIPHEGGGGFKAQARIPPGQRKIRPKGGVVLLFPRASFRCFRFFGVSVVRCFVVVSFRRSFCRGVVVLPADEEIYPNPWKFCLKSIKIHPKWV